MHRLTWTASTGSTRHDRARRRRERAMLGTILLMLALVRQTAAQDTLPLPGPSLAARSPATAGATHTGHPRFHRLARFAGAVNAGVLSAWSAESSLPFEGLLAPGAATSLTLARLQDFPGIAFDNLIPPNPVIAAGPAHLMAVTNGTVAFFSKDGTLLRAEPLLDFLQPVSIGSLARLGKAFVFGRLRMKNAVCFAGSLPSSGGLNIAAALLAIASTTTSAPGEAVFDARAEAEAIERDS